MSIWGKLGGAAAGFLAGGPIGALAGAFAGHVLFDRSGFMVERPEEPGVAFTIAIIALGAKLAMADGVVTRDEEEAFSRVFRVPQSEQANVKRIFDMARRDTAGYDAYAAQIARMFRTSPGVLEDVMDGLFEIAKADGVFHPGEARLMEHIAEIFGFSPNVYRRIRATHFVDSADPYVILGISYEANEEEIRHTYRMLVKENHPDSLMGRGVPPEFVKLATDKLAAINTAYETIRKERDIR
jgi:DnaJ like chaperone protein